MILVSATFQQLSQMVYRWLCRMNYNQGHTRCLSEAHYFSRSHDSQINQHDYSINLASAMFVYLVVTPAVCMCVSVCVSALMYAKHSTNSQPSCRSNHPSRIPRKSLTACPSIVPYWHFSSGYHSQISVLHITWKVMHIKHFHIKTN